MNNELLLEIFQLAMQKNRREKNTIFVRFFGNVNCFEIAVYENGWHEDVKADFETDLYMDLNSEADNAIKLKEIIKYLKSLED